MAPTRPKNRKSNESATSLDLQSFPTPPQLIPTKSRSPARTPTNRSPIRKPKMRITAAQKQALIDNLQLEITERARKLRAQYALQAQGLRTRIEIRVNRIPVSLRRVKMGDLILKHSENPLKITSNLSTYPVKSILPAKTSQAGQKNARGSPAPHASTKRHSGEIMTDKENDDIDSPKKRARGPIPGERTTSKNKVPASQVLSPRSANSRTLPGSPIRQTTPRKAHLSRPVSPLKPLPPAPPGGPAGILTNMVEKAKASRGPAQVRKGAETPGAGGIGRGRRTPAPPAQPRVGRGRAASASSDGSSTTIVRKPVPVAKKVAPPPKKTVMSTIKGFGGGARKTPATKTATAGRVLRKRD